MPDLDLDTIEAAAERKICTTTGGTGDAMTIVALVAELRAARANQEPAPDATQERKQSPFDTLGETLLKILGDQLHDAITSPAFASALRSAGIAVTPACDGVPEQSETWANYALDLISTGTGAWTDVRNQVDELWRLAYEAGWQGYAAQRDDLKAELERSESVKAELRRQLDAQRRQVAELRWAARYLPLAVRAQVMADPPTPGTWRGDRPDDNWTKRVDHRAAVAGLTPYPDSQP